MQKLTSGSRSDHSALDAIPIPSESNQFLRSSGDVLPSVTGDDVTHTSPSTSSPRKGPTSSGFAFDVARERLQTLGLDAVESRPFSYEDELDFGASPRHLLDSYGNFKRLLNKDPLWQMDPQEVCRLIDIFANGVGAMNPVVDIDKLRSRWDSLHSMMTSAKASRNTDRLLLTAEAMFNTDTHILKLVLANSLTAGSGGMNQMAKRLFDSIGGAHQSAYWEAPSLKNISLLVLVVRRYRYTSIHRPTLTL